MTPVIYIDVLFFTNFIVNYFLLYITQKILYIKTSKTKKVIAASLGGIYSCLIFFPELSGLYTFYSKVIFSLVITYMAFPTRKILIFAKAVAVFYTASFLMCGVTFALLFVTKGFEGGVGETNNGVFYFNLDWGVLVAGGLVCSVAVRIVNRILMSHKGTIYKEVKIYLNDNSVTLLGMVDTGNRLKDPVSGEAVIVCEFKSVEKLFNEQMRGFFERNTDELSEKDLEMLSGIRLIPYDSIGNNGGIIKGFLSDSVEVDNKIYKRITVAVHQGKLSNDLDYKVLLGARFL